LRNTWTVRVALDLLLKKPVHKSALENGVLEIATGRLIKPNFTVLESPVFRTPDWSRHEVNLAVVCERNPSLATKAAMRTV
jgi:hypothetical protein